MTGQRIAERCTERTVDEDQREDFGDERKEDQRPKLGFGRAAPRLDEERRCQHRKGDAA